MLVLLILLVANLAASVMVWRMDLLVHADLYTHGLIFNHSWADPYWYCTTVLWILLFIATVLTGATIVTHYLYSRKITSISKWTGFFLPVLAFVFQGLSLLYLNEKNSIVWNTLSNYGVQYDVNWVTAYNLLSASTIVLMAVTLLGLIIPALRASGYEIQITRG